MHGDLRNINKQVNVSNNSNIARSTVETTETETNLPEYYRQTNEAALGNMTPSSVLTSSKLGKGWGGGAKIQTRIILGYFSYISTSAKISLERRDGSNEESQPRFLLRNINFWNTAEDIIISDVVKFYLFQVS